MRICTLCAVSQSNKDQAKGTLGRDSIHLLREKKDLYLSGTAVLLATNSLGGDKGSLLGLDLGHWLGSLVLGSSRIHLRSRVLGDAIDGAVAGHFGLKSVNKKSEKKENQKTVIFSPVRDQSEKQLVWRTRDRTERDDLTVRFLVSGSGAWTAELLRFLSSRIGDEERSIVRDEEVLKVKAR